MYKLVVEIGSYWSNMDKAWAWLPRNSLEYEIGAKNFVYGASSSMGNPAKILCPCVDCRNVCHQLLDTVVDHLVMRGMDLKYKRNPCWFNHGDRRERTSGDVLTSEEEAYDLIRTAYFESEVGDEHPSEKKSHNVGAHSGVSHVSGGVRCQLLDWIADEDIVVSEGEFCSFDPLYKIGRIPIGPNAAAVIVKSVIHPCSQLWRPAQNIVTLGEAVGLKILWQGDKVILDEDISTSPNITSGSKIDLVLRATAYLWRPTSDLHVMADAMYREIQWPLTKMKRISQNAEVPSVRSSHGNGSSNSGSSAGKNKKCFLLYCKNSGNTVAEGRVCSTDPVDKVHNRPLGPTLQENMELATTRCD